MTAWRFAFTRRWAGYLALTIAFAIACSFLGQWQFSRRADARAEIARIDANYDAPPVPLDSALPSLDAFETAQKWQSVEVDGVYLTEQQLLVRNRPLGGRPGFEVLTPLLRPDGTIFIVDRGWVPTGEEQDAPDVVPAPPLGPVTVVARLKAGEPTLPGRRTVEGSGEIPTVNLPQIEDMVDGPVFTGAYGLVAFEDPAPETAPIRSSRPIRDEGPHLSYALQWYVFALLAFIGLGWALRQEYREVNADDPEERERAEERSRRKALKAPDDAEIEDAILGSEDAANAQASEIRSA